MISIKNQSVPLSFHKNTNKKAFQMLSRIQALLKSEFIKKSPSHRYAKVNKVNQVESKGSKRDRNQ